MVRSDTITGTHSAPTNVCGAETVHPGLWYTYEGTGYPIELSACPSDGVFDFEVSVSIFSGDNCGALECITGVTFSEDFCKPAQNNTSTILARFLDEEEQLPSITVESEVGATYYIFVHGQESVTPNNTGIGVGGFELIYKSQQPPPPATAPGDSGSSEGGGGGNGNDITTGNGNGSGSSQTDSDLSEKNEKSGFKKMNLLYLLLLLLLIPLCILREKLRKNKSNNNSPSKPDDEPVVEDAEFNDERAFAEDLDRQQSFIERY